MKAIELMIGDWVYNCGNPMQITIFDSDFDNFIDPILLTAEILKKNGFYVYDKDDYSDAKLDINVDEDNLYQISIKRKGDNYHIAIHYIKWLNHKTGNYDSQCLYSNGLFSDFKPLYVHKLQHALRLCDVSQLDELANNFKI